MKILPNKPNIEILGPGGFKPFLGLRVSETDQFIEIRFANGNKISCTLDHVFYDEKTFREITARKFRVGSKFNNTKVISIKLIKEKINVYDPIEVMDGNIFYSNGIISHNCAFLGSDFTLLNAEALRLLSPTRPLSSIDGLDIFTPPEPDRVYTLIADVAKGVGGDYSAFQVIDITSLPYKQVAKFRDNNISPLLYPSVIYKAGTTYNNAFVLIETNVSEQVAHILYYEMEYENLLFVARTQKGQLVSSGFSRGTTTLGVNTDKKVKRIGCVNLKTLIEEKKLLVQDSDTIAEFGTFIQSKDSYAADEGYHDDLVMPLVLFGWFTSNPSFRDFSDISLRHAMFEKRMQQIEDEMIPIGHFSNGIENEKEIVHNF